MDTQTGREELRIFFRPLDVQAIDAERGGHYVNQPRRPDRTSREKPILRPDFLNDRFISPAGYLHKVRLDPTTVPWQGAVVVGPQELRDQSKDIKSTRMRLLFSLHKSRYDTRARAPRCGRGVVKW